MRQTKKHHSISNRWRIVALFQENKSYSEISEIMGIPKSTIQSIIKKYMENKEVIDLKGKGRKRKTSVAQDRKIVKYVRKNFEVSSRDLAKNIKSEMNIEVSKDTIISRCSEKGLKPRIRRKKPFLSIENINKRKKFSEKYLSWTTEDWSNVLFSDEVKIQLHSSDGVQWIWRYDYEELEPGFINKTFKHSDQCMVWCCISYNGVGDIYFIDENLTGSIYLKILKRNLIKNGQRLIGEDFYFQQDNDPKHKSDIVEFWLDQKGIKLINHPPQSPDLNPIENCFSYLKSKLRKINIKNKIDLKEKITEVWNSISKEYCNKLSDSMEDRVIELFEKKGGYISY